MNKTKYFLDLECVNNIVNKIFIDEIARDEKYIKIELFVSMSYIFRYH